MADLDFEALVKEDKLPNKPNIIEGIKSGRLDADRAMAAYEKYKAAKAKPPEESVAPKTAAPTPEPTKVPTPSQTPTVASGEPPPSEATALSKPTPKSSPWAVTAVSARDQMLKGLVDADKLPPKASLLQGIIDGRLDLDRAQKAYATYKSRHPAMVYNDKGQVDNRSSTLQQTAKAEAEQTNTGVRQSYDGMFFDGMSQVFKDDIYYAKRFGQGFQKGFQGAPNVQFMKEKADGMVQEMGGGLTEFIGTGVGGFIRGTQADLDWFTQGATFGIHQAQYQPKNLAEKIVLKGIEFGGMAVGFAMGEQILAAIPGIGSGIQAIKAGAAETLQTAKTAKLASKLGIAGPEVVPSAFKQAGAIVTTHGITGGPIGFATGFLRAKIHGESFSDALSEGIYDALFFTAFGSALHKPLELVSGAFARPKIERGKRLMDTFREKTKDMAEEYSKPLEKGAAESGIDFKIMRLENIPSAELNPEQTKALLALKKIKAAQPIAGPLQGAELQKHPETFMHLAKEDMKMAADNLFTRENAPLKNLYDNNKSLQGMVKQGDYAGALQVADGEYRTAVKDYKTFGEVVAAPFMHDIKIIGDIVSQRWLPEIESGKYKGLTTNLIAKHLVNPTAETEAAIKATTPKGGVQGLLGKQALEKPMDLRMRPEELDQLVGQHLQASLDTLMNGGVIKFENLGLVKDTMGAVNAAVSFNKQLFTTILGAYTEGYGRYAPDIRYAPKEIQDLLTSEINSRRVMWERSEATNRLAQVRSRIGDIEKMSLRERSRLGNELSGLKLERKNINGKLGLLQRTWNKEQTQLNSADPESLAQVKEFASQIWIPSKLEMGMDPRATTNWLERYGYKDNPAYIGAGSKLAEQMNITAVAGQDLDLGPVSSLGGLLIKIDNYRQKLNRFFGPNNSFEQMFYRMKDRMVMAKNKTEADFAELKSIGIKAWSDEDKLLHAFAENRIQVTSREFLELPTKVQEKLIQGKKIIGDMYEKFLNMHNEMARKNNIPEIGKRDDYITHVPEMDGSYEGFLRLLFGGENKNSFDGNKPYNLSSKTYKADPRKRFLSWELQRTGNEFQEGAVGSMGTYIERMNDRIFMTEMITEIDAARNFAPKKLGEFLNNVKESILIGKEHPWDTTKSISPGLKSRITFTGKLLDQGVLLGSALTVLRQYASSAVNFAHSPKLGMAAILKMGTMDGERIWANSLNRTIRKSQSDTDLGSQEMSGMIGKWMKHEPIKSAANAFEYFKDWAWFSLRKADEFAAKHANIVGYLKAKADFPQMDDAHAYIYADHYTDMMQGSMTKLDKPEILHSTIGRALAKYQVFTINFAATMMNDLPNMVFHDGAAKAVNQIMNVYAASTIINQMLSEIGFPEMFRVDEYIPLMGTANFGVPGYVGGIFEVARDFKLMLEGHPVRAAKSLGKAAAMQLIPGYKQGLATYKGIKEVSKGKVPASKIPGVLLFGPRVLDKRKKNIFEKVRESGKKMIKKQLFRQDPEVTFKRY